MEKGHIVQFGPRTDDNLIKHVTAGQTVPMARKGESYVLGAEFMIAEGTNNFALLGRAMTKI